MAHPLDGAYLRIERAKQHIADLAARESEFRAAYKKDLVVQFDAATEVARIVLKRDVPPIFSVITGEAAYNLRAALDYLVAELSKLDSGKIRGGTKFPIEDSPKSFWGKVRGRTIQGCKRTADRNPLKGLSDLHVAKIEGLQHYNGHAWLKTLREISNPDKHRELTVTLGSVVGMATFRREPWLPHDILRGIPTYVNGEKLDTRFPGSGEADVYHDLTIYITLGKGPGVVNALQMLQRQVPATLDLFKPDFES